MAVFIPVGFQVPRIRIGCESDSAASFRVHRIRQAGRNGCLSQTDDPAVMGIEAVSVGGSDIDIDRVRILLPFYIYMIHNFPVLSRLYPCRPAAVQVEQKIPIDLDAAFNSFSVISSIDTGRFGTFHVKYSRTRTKVYFFGGIIIDTVGSSVRMHGSVALKVHSDRTTPPVAVGFIPMTTVHPGKHF